jgi:hypothetical protein
VGQLCYLGEIGILKLSFGCQIVFAIPRTILATMDNFRTQIAQLTHLLHIRKCYIYVNNNVFVYPSAIFGEPNLDISDSFKAGCTPVSWNNIYPKKLSSVDLLYHWCPVKLVSNCSMHVWQPTWCGIIFISCCSLLLDLSELCCHCDSCQAGAPTLFRFPVYLSHFQFSWNRNEMEVWP